MSEHGGRRSGAYGFVDCGGHDVQRAESPARQLSAGTSAPGEYP